jgi:hypothetical protein
MQNKHEIALSDGRKVLVSYTTPVCVFVPGRGYLVSEHSFGFSPTTSKHIRSFSGMGKGGFNGSQVLDIDLFKKAIEPIEYR